MGRHRPLNGADSAEAWHPVPWDVVVEEEMGSRLEIRVNAIGRNDARGQAIEEARRRGYFDVTALTAEQVAR